MLNFFTVANFILSTKLINPNFSRNTSSPLLQIRDSDEKVRDAGFSWKRSGNAGSGSPLPDPDCVVDSLACRLDFGEERNLLPATSVVLD